VTQPRRQTQASSFGQLNSAVGEPSLIEGFSQFRENQGSQQFVDRVKIGLDILAPADCTTEGFKPSGIMDPKLTSGTKGANFAANTWRDFRRGGRSPRQKLMRENLGPSVQRPKPSQKSCQFELRFKPATKDSGSFLKDAHQPTGLQGLVSGTNTCMLGSKCSKPEIHIDSEFDVLSGAPLVQASSIEFDKLSQLSTCVDGGHSATIGTLQCQLRTMCVMQEAWASGRATHVLELLGADGVEPGLVCRALGAMTKTCRPWCLKEVAVTCELAAKLCGPCAEPAAEAATRCARHIASSIKSQPSGELTSEEHFDLEKLLYALKDMVTQLEDMPIQAWYLELKSLLDELLHATQ